MYKLLRGGCTNTQKAEYKVRWQSKYKYVQTRSISTFKLNVQVFNFCMYKKKGSLKPIDMGFSFEDLDARSF